MIETFSGTSVLAAADAAAKAARVTLFRIHVAMALGGKGLCLMTGTRGRRPGRRAGRRRRGPPPRPAGLRNRHPPPEQGAVRRLSVTPARRTGEPGRPRPACPAAVELGIFQISLILFQFREFRGGGDAEAEVFQQAVGDAVDPAVDGERLPASPGILHGGRVADVGYLLRRRSARRGGRARAASSAMAASSRGAFGGRRGCGGASCRSARGRGSIAARTPPQP